MIKFGSHRKINPLKITKKLFSPLVVTLIIIEGLFLTLFINTTLKVLDSALVDTILSLVESNISNDLYTFLVLCLSSYLVFQNPLKWQENLSPVLLVINLVVYFIYRENQIYWQLTELYSLNGLYYTDSLAAIGFLLLFNSSKDTQTNELKKNTKFLEDIPISDESKDRLELSSYANSIFESIQESSFEQAFTIGINGKWGYGKSSLLKLIRKQLEINKHIVFEFNPWMYTHHSIQQKFFEDLLVTLGSQQAIVSSKIQRYSNKINDTNKPTVLHLIQELFLPSKNTEELLADVKNEIINLNKQLFVVIDDLDRLNNEELYEVLKIIRNTANLPNTIYFIAYDRAFIDKSLENVNNYNANEYLDKIVNLELVLPGIRRGSLSKILVEELGKYLDDQDMRKIKEAILGSFATSSSLFLNGIESIRHVKRLVNSFITNSKNLTGNINIVDFLMLELLKTKYPSAYSVFQRKHFEYLNSSEKNNNLIGVNQLKLIPNETRGESEKEKRAMYEYELDWVRSQENITVADLLWVRKVFQFLFPASSIGKHEDSICYSNCTERYFTYALIGSELSRLEFESTMNFELNELKNAIDKWIIEGKEISLRHFFYTVKLSKDPIQNIKIIEAIFHFASSKSQFNIPYCGGLIPYDLHDLTSKIRTTFQLLEVKKKAEQEIFQDKIYNIISGSEYSKVLCSSLINHNLDGSKLDLPFQRETLMDINYNFLKSHINECNSLNDLTWSFFRNCGYKKWVQTSSSSWTSTETSYDPRSIVLMTELILNHQLDVYILTILKRDPFDGQNITVSDSFKLLFGDLDGLIESVERAPKSPFKDEFVKLLKKCKAEEKLNNIQFDFQIIPV